MTRRKVRLRLSVEAPEGEEDVVVTASSDGHAFSVERRGSTSTAELASLPDGRLSLLFGDGRQLCARPKPSEGAMCLSTPRGTRHVPIVDPRRHRAGSQDAGIETGREEVIALMPGRVLEVSAKEGENVAAGAVLLVLEAMKMEHQMVARDVGVVTKVRVEVGQMVDPDEILVVVEAE